MTFERDNDLLVFYRKILKGQHCFGRKPTKLWLNAELLWAGEHYLLVRQGPAEGQRLTVLLNRESLLLRRGNKEKHPLIALALAAIHPVHRLHPQRMERLHSTRQDFGYAHELFKGLRWSKRLLCDLIFFAKNKDMTFEADEASWIADYEAKAAFSNKALEGFEQATGTRLVGSKSKNGYKRSHDNLYRTPKDETAGPFTGQVQIHPRGCNRSVRLTCNSSMLFSEEEFNVFIDALTTIRQMKEERSRAALP